MRHFENVDARLGSPLSSFVHYSGKPISRVCGFISGCVHLPISRVAKSELLLVKLKIYSRYIILT